MYLKINRSPFVILPLLSKDFVIEPNDRKNDQDKTDYFKHVIPLLADKENKKPSS